MTASPRTDPVAAEAAAIGPVCGDEFGWCLSTVVRAFGHWAADSVTDLPGGPRGHLVLAAIAGEPPSSQLALAHHLGVDRTVMTYLLDELERAGLVERRPDPADRRARQILITEAGRTALDEFRTRLREVEARLLAPLDPAEATAFRDLLARVAHAAHTTADASAGDACSGSTEL